MRFIHSFNTPPPPSEGSQKSRVGTMDVKVHKIHGSVRYDTVVSRFGTFSIRGAGRFVTSQCWKYLFITTFTCANLAQDLCW